MFNSSSPSAAYIHQWIRGSIGSGNGLSPVRRQAVTWTNAGSLQIGLLGTKFQWKLNWNFIIFIQENALEIVICQSGSHFVQGRWINSLISDLKQRKYQSSQLLILCSVQNKIWNLPDWSTILPKSIWQRRKACRTYPNFADQDPRSGTYFKDWLCEGNPPVTGGFSS